VIAAPLHGTMMEATLPTVVLHLPQLTEVNDHDGFGPAVIGDASAFPCQTDSLPGTV